MIGKPTSTPFPTSSAPHKMRHDNFIHPARGLRIRDRGRMPHWEVEDSAYFVTFRLRDSLPRDVTRMLLRDRERSMASATTAIARAEVNRAFGDRLDQYLDVGSGSSILREHADLVADSLKHFDGERYELLAWCVMPNHVHVLFFVPGAAELDRIVHSWKSYTAHRIGRGVIWAREYFDRVVRGPRELERIRNYIHANPWRAGLRDWPFVG
jgi:REP element-mobilizing transposase RayT